MADEVLLLDNPELSPAFEVVDTIVRESDRGAVLIATSLVDEYLRKGFEGIAPPRTHKTLRSMLKYPGPLSSLAGKADIALVTRLINVELHRSIHTLRGIRNEVAHSPTAFKLADHLDRVRSMYELGAGFPQFINETAARVLIEGIVGHLIEWDQAHPGDERSFKSPRDVLEVLQRNEDAMHTLQEKAYRAELGLAVVIICGLLLWRRDHFAAGGSSASVREDAEPEANGV